MGERWKLEARRWTEAWDALNPGDPWNAGELISKMEGRLPAEVLWKLSKAFDERLIATDPDAGRGHFIRVREGPRISTMGIANKATAFWELFVQLAEYRSLCIALAHRDDVEVGLEDRRMDITVRERGKLVAYVEVKEQAPKAEALAREMRALSGTPLGPPTGSSASRSDGERKVRYLLDDFTESQREPGAVQFAIRSGGRSGAALHEDRYLAHVDPVARTVTLEPGPPESLVEWADVTFATDDTRRASAILAWRVVRSATEPMFVDLGRVKTHRVYRIVDGTPRLALEFQRSGKVLAHRKESGLSEAQLDRLRDVLDASNLDLRDRHPDGSAKAFCQWHDRDTGEGWVPTVARAQALAPAVAKVLSVST